MERMAASWSLDIRAYTIYDGGYNNDDNIPIVEGKVAYIKHSLRKSGQFRVWSSEPL